MTAPSVVYAPAVSMRRSPTSGGGGGGAGGGGAGMIVSTRLDVVSATLFTDAAASRTPLARLSLRRITADARLAPGTALELMASAEASHFNPRTAAWEPIIEPWDVQATYGVMDSGGGGGGGDGVDLRPPGYSLRVLGATPLRTVVTHAFADDVIGAYAASLQGSDGGATSGGAGAGSGGGLVNALGQKVWVRSRGGRVAETPVGGVLPFVGTEKAPPVIEGNGAALAATSSSAASPRAITRDPAYLLVEVLEMSVVAAASNTSGGGSNGDAPPAPLEVLRFSCEHDFGGGAASSIPAGADVGAALVGRCRLTLSNPS